MLRHLCLFIALLITVLPWEVAGQQWFQGPVGSYVPPQSANGSRYKVSGTVVNSATGEPIGRAMVRINGSANQQMFTDGSGRFEANDIPVGQIVVTAQRPGFVNTQMSGIRSQMITVGPSTPSIEVKLMPEGFIRGKVTDNEGEPLEDINVQVLFQGITNGRKQWMNRGGAQTDENGEYFLEDLPPGQYFIRTATRAVFPVNAPAANSPYTDVYPPQYFPNAPSRDSAQPVIVGPGQTAEADFRLSPVPSYSITGVVSGPQNMWVTCQNEEGDPLSSSPVNHRTNQFRLTHLPTGSCTITAHAQSPNGEAYYAELPVTINSANITGAQLALQSLSDIPIHFSNPNGPNSNNGVPVQLQLTSRQSHRQQEFYSTMEGGPSDNQKPVFKSVVPGSYQVTSQSFNNVCIGSISSGGTDLLRDDLVVTSGTAQAAPIDVSLRNDCGTLTATTDAPAGTNTSILLMSASAGMQPRIFNFGGSTISIPGLTPGEYTVYAFSDISDLEYANGEALRKFSGQKVTIGPGETAKAQLNLIIRGDSQ